MVCLFQDRTLLKVQIDGTCLLDIISTCGPLKCQSWTRQHTCSDTVRSVRFRWDNQWITSCGLFFFLSTNNIIVVYPEKCTKDTLKDLQAHTSTPSPHEKIVKHIHRHIVLMTKMIKSGVLIWTVLNMSKQQLARLPVLPSSFQLVINNFYQNVQQRYIFHCVFPLKFTPLHRNSYKCCQVPDQKFHSFVDKKRRLPVTCTDEIEQILNENADIISEYATFLGCAESSVRNMVRRETRLVTSFSKHEVLAKMKLLLDHGLDGEEIAQRWAFWFLNDTSNIFLSFIVLRTSHALYLLLVQREADFSRKGMMNN